MEAILKAVAKAMDADRTLIRGLQWSEEGGTENTGWGRCPECKAPDWHAHNNDCAVKRTLDEHDKAAERLGKLIKSIEKPRPVSMARIRRIKQMNKPAPCESPAAQPYALVIRGGTVPGQKPRTKVVYISGFEGDGGFRGFIDRGNKWSKRPAHIRAGDIIETFESAPGEHSLKIARNKLRVS